MTTTTSRPSARRLSIAALTLVALLAGGCGGESARQAAGRSATPAPTSAAPSPSRTDTQPLTASELAWIRAVERLQPAMRKVFTDSSTDLSPATLAQLADQLGGCRRELTRMGSASGRLRPVHALVEQACGAYDKSAACFAAAARAGTPSSEESLSAIEQQIDCGFAAAETGWKSLAEARVAAARIKLTSPRRQA